MRWYQAGDQLSRNRRTILTSARLHGRDRRQQAAQFGIEIGEDRGGQDLHSYELVGRPGCIEQRTTKFLRECLSLDVDLECDPDFHPWIEEEISKCGWFVTMLIEPGSHIRQLPGEIVFVD